MKKIVYEQRWVTPLNAKDYLDNQVKPNRSISKSLTVKYARDMLNDDWDENGKTIALNPDGKMLDGQHRMQAVIVAEKMARENPDDYLLTPFDGLYLDFALGVPNEYRKSMDIGRKRSFGDELTFRGAVQSMQVAPVVNWHLSYLKGNYINSAGDNMFRATEAEALEHWKANEDKFHTTILRSRDAYRQKLGSNSALGTAYHVLRTQYGDDLADAFWDPFLTGANMAVSDPILTLRNRMLREKFSTKVQLALVFRAWNYWIDGKPAKSLYFKDEITNKNFPLPRDPKAKRTPKPPADDN